MAAKVRMKRKKRSAWKVSRKVRRARRAAPEKKRTHTKTPRHEENPLFVWISVGLLAVEPGTGSDFAASRLVGYPPRTYLLFRPLPRMGFFTRRRKGSKKLLCRAILRRTKGRWVFGRRPGGTSDEINSRLEPVYTEFIAKQRSSEVFLATSQTVDRAFRMNG